ncbi:MAG: hypothetical protein ABJD07_10060 [Gemmatimonadaceae bacterium]
MPSTLSERQPELPSGRCSMFFGTPGARRTSSNVDFLSMSCSGGNTGPVAGAYATIVSPG